MAHVMDHLSELAVLIIDCQTTGATPALGAVLEIGWCLTRAAQGTPEQLQAHWVELPQGRPVPREVRRLTGYDEGNLQGAVSPEEAWRRLCATLISRPMPAAIHFARFELEFLRDWAARFAPGEPFPLAPVCVHAIAQRLYPDLPRRSLRALAGHLGHSLELRRNARGHAEATAFIWSKLCADLARLGVRTWPELGAWLELRAPAVRSKKRAYPMPRSRCRELPDEPGVYRFLRSNGDVLYVGKASRLQRRVASHFGARPSREHSIEMLTQVSDVHVTLTPTALEAALLENETIKALRPPYNVQLTDYDASAWYADRSFLGTQERPDESHRIGPLPSPRALSPLGAHVALCSGEPRARALRGQAVAAAERWAPDEGVFAAGFEQFAARYFEPLGSDEVPRRWVLRAAKRVVSSARELARVAGAAPARARVADDPAASAPSAPTSWDPERVARHLERALGQAYRLLRRAMWLALLADSAVAFREPGSQRGRLLRLLRAQIVEARDADIDEAPREHLPRARGRRQLPALSRAEYDRLRVLTTELERVRSDGGGVAVYVRGRRLGERVLQGIFDWV